MMVDDFVDLLNSITLCDAESVKKLVEGRVKFGGEVSGYPYLIVFDDGNDTFLSWLGIINTILKKRGEPLLYAILKDDGSESVIRWESGPS